MQMSAVLNPGIPCMSGHHAQYGLTQPQCLSPPSVALVRYGVAFSPDT
jgi:hypothetical protein